MLKRTFLPTFLIICITLLSNSAVLLAGPWGGSAALKLSLELQRGDLRSSTDYGIEVTQYQPGILVEATQNVGHVSVMVYNQFGRVIYDSGFSTTSGEYERSITTSNWVSCWGPGTYHIVITLDNGTKLNGYFNL